MGIPYGYRAGQDRAPTCFLFGAMWASTPTDYCLFSFNLCSQSINRISKFCFDVLMMLSKIKPENSDCSVHTKSSMLTIIDGTLISPVWNNAITAGTKKSNPKIAIIPAIIEKKLNGL